MDGWVGAWVGRWGGGSVGGRWVCGCVGGSVGRWVVGKLLSDCVIRWVVQWFIRFPSVPSIAMVCVHFYTWPGQHAKISAPAAGLPAISTLGR